MICHSYGASSHHVSILMWIVLFFPFLSSPHAGRHFGRICTHGTIGDGTMDSVIATHTILVHCVTLLDESRRIVMVACYVRQGLVGLYRRGQCIATTTRFKRSFEPYGILTITTTIAEIWFENGVTVVLCLCI